MRSKIIKNDLLKFEYEVYENSDVFNVTTSRLLKPSNDPRRPKEPPIIYFKKKDNVGGPKRITMYLDQLIASLFHENEYSPGCFIYHKDGDINNCSADNLVCGDGIKLLVECFNETLVWKKVEIKGYNLYYDYYICEDGRLFNATTGSFILPFEDKREGNYGNLRYNLYIGKLSSEVIHISASRLVALHYLKPDSTKEIILFKDRDHSNLHFTNLYWGDYWDSTHQDMTLEEREECREFETLHNDILGKEKWKELEIPGLEFKYTYLISNFGRVYNDTKKYYCSELNSGHPNLIGQCHKNISLKMKDGSVKYIGLHRLVAFMFVKGFSETKCIVNHINGNPECNWYINLEWCSYIDNINHAIETNLLHTSKFESKVDETKWRINTIIAWIYSSMKSISHEKAFNMYNTYIETTIDDCPSLTLNEFIELFNNKLSFDNDFKTLLLFYKSSYNIKERRKSKK